MSWLRRRMMANMGGADPYAGFTFGYGINGEGNLYENANLCVSDFIPMPASLTSTYLMTEFAGPYVNGNSNVGNMCMCFYDENKNFVAYTMYNIINRTSENTAPHAYVRFCCYAPAIDTAFLRVTNNDASHSYYDLFAGTQVPDSYKNVLYGYYYNADQRRFIKNISTGSLGSSCSVGYYSPIPVPSDCNSIRMNIYTSTVLDNPGLIVFLDENKAYANYWQQNAVNRVFTDNRIGSTYKYFYKNTYSKHIDTTYVLDLVHNQYLFKGISV